MNVLEMLARPGQTNDRVSHSGMMLPNQEFFSGLYQGQYFDNALYSMVTAFTRGYGQHRFKIEIPEGVVVDQLSSPPMTVALLGMMAKLVAANNVLEIGTFVGVTAMHLAQMCTGHVTTIELGQQFASIARKNFHENNLNKRITLIQGDASNILPSLTPNHYDLIFVDGGKQDYLQYVRKSERLLSEHGAIIVDDVLFHGDALNKVPQTDKGRGCKMLLEAYQSKTDFGRLLLPIANGVLILFRK